MVVSECVKEAIMEEMDYESKRSVKRIVDECVRNAVNEAMGRYNGGYNGHGDPISDKKYINSYEYLLDSMINGNWSQAKNMYRKVRNKKDFYDFVSETCPDMLDDINLLER